MYSPADRPSSTRAAPAKKRNWSTIGGISSVAVSSRGLPVLRHSASGSPSALASPASAIFSRARCRCEGVVSRQTSNAAAAAAMAWSTSAGPETGADANTSPVLGSTRSAYPPSDGSTYLAFTKLRSTWVISSPELVHPRAIGPSSCHLRERFRCLQPLVRLFPCRVAGLVFRLCRPTRTSSPRRAGSVRRTVSPKSDPRRSTMAVSSRPFYVAGSAERGEDELVVRHPYDGREVGRTSFATPAQVEGAGAGAAEVVSAGAALPAHVRAAALDHVSRRLAERAEEVARLITAE